VLVLIWGNQITMERFWWSLATVVLGLAIVQVLVGAGKADDATGPPTDDAILVDAT
jgi:hypothetical protein